MKIVYCIPQLYRPGGIERIVTLKTNYLTEVYGYDVTIVTADQKEMNPFYELNKKVKMIDLGLDYDGTLSLPIAKRFMARSRLHRLHKEKLTALLMKIRPDVTVSTFTHEASFLPGIKDGSKKVLEFHFCRGHKRKMADAFCFPFFKRTAYKFRCWQEENVIIPKYDKFVVLTEEDREQWLNKTHNVVNIPNALPFETDEVAKLENHSVIAVGRLDAQKGFDRLIDIWHEVKKKKNNWKLHIYGQGADEKRLRSQITTLGLNGKVIIHKPSNNIKSYYLKASIFVMTSRYEGLPMTLLEATSVGLPAVCYNFKCGPKDIIKNGENGMIIKDGDESGMIKSLLSLMCDMQLRKRLGKNAKTYSVSYSAKMIMEKWDKLFCSLLESK